MDDVRIIETAEGWMLRCRICGFHVIPKQGRPGRIWHFVNHDLCSPTFRPSMNELRNGLGPEHNPDVAVCRCHFVIAEGRIAYCSDCTHELRGQTLPLEPWPDAEVRYYAGLLQKP